MKWPLFPNLVSYFSMCSMSECKVVCKSNKIIFALLSVFDFRKLLKLCKRVSPHVHDGRLTSEQGVPDFMLEVREIGGGAPTLNLVPMVPGCFLRRTTVTVFLPCVSGY